MNLTASATLMFYKSLFCTVIMSRIFDILYYILPTSISNKINIMSHFYRYGSINKCIYALQVE